MLRTGHTFVHASILLVEFSVYKLKLITPSKYGKWLAYRIEKLGGIYIKLGQLLSVRPDLISFAVADQLYSLLQNLRPASFRYIIKTIETQLGDTFKDNITAIEPVPVATGSIAQVHKLTLANGETAAVKILKPGIKKYLESDLKTLRFFMKMGACIPGIKRLPVKELGRELDTLIRQQLDLRQEANNLMQFKNNFAGNSAILIPDVNRNLVFPEFIVLQFLSLPAETDFENWPPEKRSNVAKKALEILYQMMFKDGLTHCDLHRGNFFITPEGTFILLDFGMVNRMEYEFRIEFIKFFYYMSTNNGKGCAAIIEKTALHKSKRFNREKLYKEVCLFISDYSSLPADEFSVLSFTKRMIQVERDCGIKGSTGFINNIIAIAFFESHLKKIDPGIDFQEEATRYIMANARALKAVFDEI